MSGAKSQPRAGNRSETSLLGRLRADDLQVRVGAKDALEARLESIKANLLKVLNARAGESLSAPGFGLNDFNDATLGSSDMLRVVSTDVRRAISDYEPRITDVHVRFDRAQAGGMELALNISARTRIHHRDEQVVIDLVLANGRSFRTI